ncbi:MAG: hypothetical protein NDI60_09070 [Elusimicrobiales bacterium]|nr:hypothetical protein [Elusimicrobiales bacterium]
MNLNKADSYIPVLAKTALDMPPLWGRLTSLSPGEAELLSHFDLPAGRELALSFEVGGAAFEDVRAKITAALKDADGYFNYRLVFRDPAQRELLGAALAAAVRPPPVSGSAAK